jgi:MFS-type transporter involved in bile tolerance (Atg22 family)
MSSLSIFYGAVVIILFGFLAAFLTPVLQNVLPQYSEPQTQMILFIIIPVMSIAILYGVFGGGGE